MFDRGDRIGLATEELHRSLVAIHSIGSDDVRGNRGGLDNGALGSEVAAGKHDGAGQAARSREGWRHDHVVGIHVVLREEQFAEPPPPLRVFPEFEFLAPGPAGGGHGAEPEYAQGPQVEHHFRYAAGEEDADRGMVLGAVGQRIDDPGDFLVHGDPVVHRRPAQAGGMGDGGNMQQQVCRAAEGRMDHHGVRECIVGDDVATGEAALFEGQQGRRGSAGHVGPDRLARGCEGGVGQGEAESLGDDL